MSLTLKSAYELSEQLKNKEISSEELTRSYLDRINEVEDKVGSYVTVCEEDAIKTAKNIDERRAKGEKLGPLAGSPIGVKDNICTRDLKTT